MKALLKDRIMRSLNELWKFKMNAIFSALELCLWETVELWGLLQSERWKTACPPQ